MRSQFNQTSGSFTHASKDDYHLLRGLGLSVGQGMLVFSILIGLAAGLAASGFYWMLNSFVQIFLTNRPQALTPVGIAIILLSPAIGGLVCGILLHYFSPDARGGVTEVIDAILRRNGYIRPRVGFFKAIASAICIGSGGSAGREGPVVQIGASVGSTLTQIFRVKKTNAQVLVACGVAGGISAVFNAPIAGAFFAAEIIIGRFEMKNLSLLFTASAMGAAIARTLLHSRATFELPPFELVSIWTLAFHATLGALCAFLGHAFIALLHESEIYFGKLRLPFIVKPALGGLAVGIIGLWIPQVFGTGGELLETIFQNPIAPGLLLLWMAGKFIATPLTLGSGGSGGDLMPSLFLGGTLGGAFGHYVQSAFPHAAMPANAYALVGATALFAGVSHAPMTAIILGFEMGRDYGVILPLMVACSVSALVSRHLRTGSLYTGKLIEKGIDIDRLRGSQIDPLDFVQVNEVMTQNPISVSESTPLAELSNLFVSTGKHGFVVIADHQLTGIVTLSDLQKQLELGEMNRYVRDIETTDPVVCYPADTLAKALTRLGNLDVGRMPVVLESAPTKVVGILSRRDIIRGYSIGLSRCNLDR